MKIINVILRKKLSKTDSAWLE